MSEEPESIEYEAGNIKTLSHTRILILMGLVAVAGTVYGFIYVSASFGAGVLIGGILAFVNYYWLKHTLHVVFEQAKHGERPAFAGSRYLLRYFIFGLILLFIYLTKTVSVAAVILGLASFAFAIVIEGFIRIFTSFIK